MRGLRVILIVGLVAAGLFVSARLTIRAQDQRSREGAPPARKAEPAEGHAAAPVPTPIDGPVSLQDALRRPFAFPFREATRLDEVCRQLGQSLHAPVVLDLAALDRLDLRADDTVELALEGVRLKTGLKLLLDQVGLTYKVVPEDNLMILTDAHGSDDPLDRVVSELKALHRDVHNLQDAVDEIRDALSVEDGATMRKPTIIEEIPEPRPGPVQSPADPPPAQTTPSRSRSG